MNGEYLVLASENVRYNESLDEYSFYNMLNGLDRYPDTIQWEVRAFAKLITDDEMRYVVVDTGAACAKQ